MKRFGIMIMLLALLVCPVVYGQDEQARDLFLNYASSAKTKGRPGAKIKLELLRDGRRQFVPLNTIFRAGDKVKLHFEVNFAAQVSIFNLGTTGIVKQLYPLHGKSARAAAATDYVVPAQDTQWFEFDDTPGTEKLNFVFSSFAPQRVPVRPQTKPRPANKPTAETELVIVEPGGRALDDNEARELSDEALNNGRDLHRVQLSDGYYVLGQPQQVRQTVGILLALQHR